MRYDKISKRDVDLDYPGALSELPPGEGPTFGLLGSVLVVTFEDGRTYSWSSSAGWLPEP